MKSWKNLLCFCFKSKNHLIVLEELFDSSKSLKQIKKVNKKTLYRILKDYVNLGIIGKSKNDYFLTNKGKVLSYLALGKFQNINYEVKEDVNINLESVYIEREEVIKQILYNTKRKKNTLILGESGIGKTSLLKHLEKNYIKNTVYASVKPAKYVLEQIAKHEGIEHKKSIRTIELINKIKKANPNIILLLDELELATKQTHRIIKELERIGITIIGAGQYTKQPINFDETIKLRTLTNQECNKLVTALLSQEFENLEEIQKLILRNTDKKPENIKRACEQTKVLKELNEEAEIRKEIKPTNKRINILTTNSLVSLGYLLITLRYVFYGQKEYQIGYWLSTVAYLIFFMFRRRKK